MFGRLLILFIAIPVLELALFLKIGRHLGVGPTLGIIVLTAMLGAWLARQQGLRVLARLQTEMASGRIPHAELVDGLLILLAGALLITPGFLTDTLGFLLLAPPFRAALRPRLARALAGKVSATNTGNRPNDPAPRPKSEAKPADVIDIDAEVVDEGRKSR